jgi:hypothetical protein
MEVGNGLAYAVTNHGGSFQNAHQMVLGVDLRARLVF